MKPFGLSRTLAILGAALSLGGSAARVHAQEPRAGVVVMTGDGAVQEACVTLGEGRVTGLDLLSMAGFDVVAEVNALGSTVCAIDGSGCSYPAEPCWCECRSLGAECTYWAYHVSDGGAWRYSTLGALARVVEDGDVDGWAWGPGREGSGAEPPFRAFDQVCRDEPAEVEATRPPPDRPDPTDEPEPLEPGPEAVHDEERATESAEAAPPGGGQTAASSPGPAGVTSRVPVVGAAATVEALATGLALAGEQARAATRTGALPHSGNGGTPPLRDSNAGAAGGVPAVAPIALEEAPAVALSPESGRPPDGSTSRALPTSYAVAGLLLLGLALGGWAVRRRG